MLATSVRTRGLTSTARLLRSSHSLVPGLFWPRASVDLCPHLDFSQLDFCKYPCFSDILSLFSIVRLVSVLAIFGLGPVARPASGADYMYVSLNNNTIVRYDVSLGTSALVQASRSVFVPTGQGLNFPTGLAFDTSGNLYAANASSNTITRYDSSGTYIVGSPFISSGLNGPFGIAFDSSGNLYAANVGNKTISK